MSDVDVVFVNSEDGDWVGMYVDGVLMEQGHSIPAEWAVKHFINGAHIDSVTVESRDDWDVEEDAYHLPDKLSEVHFNGS